MPPAGDVLPVVEVGSHHDESPLPAVLARKHHQHDKSSQISISRIRLHGQCNPYSFRGGREISLLGTRLWVNIFRQEIASYEERLKLKNVKSIVDPDLEGSRTFCLSGSEPEIKWYDKNSHRHSKNCIFVKTKLYYFFL